MKQTIFSVILAALTAGAGFGQVTVVSGGNWAPTVAPDSIAAAFGNGFTTRIFSALTLPLPTNLGGVSVLVADQTKTSANAGEFMTSPEQINFAVQGGAALGKGTVTVTTSTGATQTGSILISNVAPSIFTANGNGAGVPAAQVFTVTGATTANPTTKTDSTFATGTNGYITKPFSLVPFTNNVYLILYGTGIRHRSLNPVQATINGVKVPVQYAGATANFIGLDQINVGPLPSTLAGTGKGDVNLVVTVDGVPANPVAINIQ